MKNTVGLRKGGQRVIDCQGKNGVMSQTAAVSNDVAVLHIPKQEERSTARGCGR